MPGTLFAQDVEQALNFPAQKCGIEFGGGRGFHLHGRFVQPGPRAAYGESLLVQKFANAPDQQDFVVLIVTAVAASLNGFELSEFLFPVAQHVRLHTTKLADFTDGEVALRGN